LAQESLVALPLRNIARSAALAAGFWLGAATAATAQSWIGPVVALGMDEEHECRIEVSGNGRFYRLDAWGLEPGEQARLLLFNEDMRPIERTVRVRQDGTWAEYYLPALPRHRSGVVQAYLSGARCDLRVGFAWQRPSASSRPEPAWTRSHFPED
jgi:hypothetical protein